MPRVYLSLGSNIDPEANLRLGVSELEKRYGELTLSPVYRSRAVGFEGDDFLNLVAGLKTDDTIESIAEDIEAIHRVAGRDRGAERYSSRTLDIDLLTWGDVVTTVPPVRLPRKDILEYAFVLKPLADIAPEERHPETGRRYIEHWEEMSLQAAGLNRIDVEP